MTKFGSPDLQICNLSDWSDPSAIHHMEPEPDCHQQYYDYYLSDTGENQAEVQKSTNLKSPQTCKTTGCFTENATK